MGNVKIIALKKLSETHITFEIKPDGRVLSDVIFLMADSIDRIQVQIFTKTEKKSGL